jgi:hypothetical protein
MANLPVTAPRTATTPPIRNRPATPASPAGDARELRERRIVMILVAIFILGALGLMSMNVVSSSRNARATEALGQAFVRVHSRQTEYRSLYGRFGTWAELRARGVAPPLGPSQSVVASNADGSHWFLSIRDAQTGVVCDRTGELMDAGPAERRPVCREERAG